MRQVQLGFALIELAIAALLTTLLAVWGANALVSVMNEAGAKANAQWMLAVREGARQYLERYGQELRRAQSPHDLKDAGFVDWSMPQLLELRADGLLPKDLPLNVSRGNSAQIRVLRDGQCPGAHCVLGALIHSVRPFTQGSSGRVDEQAIAQWLLATDGLGGWVSRRDDQVVRGATFSIPNPAWRGSALSPGTVAVMVRSAGEGAYLRVRDSRDPDLQGSLKVRDTITAGADLHIHGQLLLRSSTVVGSPCEQEGALGMQSRADPLVCREGAWRPLSQGMAGWYAHNSLYGCRAPRGSPNKYTGECGCPQGALEFQLSEVPPRLFAQGVTRYYLCLN